MEGTIILSKPYFLKIEGFFGDKEMAISEVGENHMVVHVELTEKDKNPLNVIHGGVLYTLGDMVSGYFSRLKGRGVTTLNGSMNYLKPAKVGHLMARGEALHKGKNTWVIGVSMYQEEICVATGTFTMFCLGDYPQVDLSEYV